jgi:hypothetical protein
MKGIGFLLLVAGFLTGAYATALDVENVNWTLFVVAAAGAVLGLVMIKRADSAHALSDAVLELNRGELRESTTSYVISARSSRIRQHAARGFVRRLTCGFAMTCGVSQMRAVAWCICLVTCGFEMTCGVSQMRAVAWCICLVCKRTPTS